MEIEVLQRPVCRLFGRVELWGRSGTRIAFISEKSKQLFAALALEKGAPVSRNLLIARLWPDGPEERLRHSLSTEVWRLRHALNQAGEDASSWIHTEPEGLSLSKKIWIDVEEFDVCAKALAQKSIDTNQLLALDSVEQLYRGDLLAEMGNDWCLIQRQTYRSRFLNCLEALLSAAKHREDWHEALRISQRILAEDCFLEHVHREIMNCYAMMGDRAAALRHYEKLQVTFREELGVAPTRETKALCNLLRGAEGIEVGLLARGPAGAQDFERRLELIQQHLEQLMHELGEFGLLLRKKGPPQTSQ
jgi:DNA-binding SARP family transcriptional activator